jgi:hypothetical protein
MHNVASLATGVAIVDKSSDSFFSGAQSLEAHPTAHG